MNRVRRAFSGNIGDTLIRGASSAAVVNLLGVAIAFVLHLALARTLGVTEYGYYVYAFAWALVLSQLCRMGFQNSLIRFGAEYEATGNWCFLKGILIRSIQVIIAASVAAAFILLAWLAYSSGDIPQELFQTFGVAAILIIPVALIGVAQGLLKGFRKPGKALLPFRVILPAGVLLMVGIAAAGSLALTAFHAMWITLFAAIGALIMSGWWLFNSLNKSVFSEKPQYITRFWLRVSIPLIVLAGMQILMKNTDTLMLGALVGTDSAGIYYPLARMSELAAIGLLATNAIVAPMIAQFHVVGDSEKLKRTIGLAVAIGMVVTLIAGILFVVLGHWLLGLFGSEFTAGYVPLLILLVGQVVNAACGPVAFIMTMTGLQDRAAIVLVVSALLNVVLNFVLIPRYGLLGAALATAICTAAWNIWLAVEVWNSHRVNPTITSVYSAFRRPAESPN